MHDAFVVLYATTAGFTASGICANAYRLFAKEARSSLGRVIYLSVMVVAGPSVLFESAMRAWRKKDCTGTALGIAAAISGYWSLALGLIVIQIALALRAP